MNEDNPNQNKSNNPEQNSNDKINQGDDDSDSRTFPVKKTVSECHPKNLNNPDLEIQKSNKSDTLVVPHTLPPNFPGGSALGMPQQYVGFGQQHNSGYIQLQPMQYPTYSQMPDLPVAQQMAYGNYPGQFPVQRQVTPLALHPMPPQPFGQQHYIQNYQPHSSVPTIVSPHVSSYMPQSAYGGMSYGARSTGPMNNYNTSSSYRYSSSLQPHNSFAKNPDEDYDDCFNIFWLFFLLGPLTWPCGVFGLFSDKRCERIAGAVSMMALIMTAIVIGLIITGS